MTWLASPSGVKHAFVKNAKISLCGWLRRSEARAPSKDDFECGSCARLAARR